MWERGAILENSWLEFPIRIRQIAAQNKQSSEGQREWVLTGCQNHKRTGAQCKLKPAPGWGNGKASVPPPLAPNSWAVGELKAYLYLQLWDLKRAFQYLSLPSKNKYYTATTNTFKAHEQVFRKSQTEGSGNAVRHTEHTNSPFQIRSVNRRLAGAVGNWQCGV